MARKHKKTRGLNLESLLDGKMKNAFTACFAPIPNCNPTMAANEHESKISIRNRSRSKQRETIRKMGDGVRKHVAQAVARTNESLEETTLLNELELKLTRDTSTHTETDQSGSRTYSETWGSGSETNLNTIGEETIENVCVDWSMQNGTRAAGSSSAEIVLGNNLNVVNDGSIKSSTPHGIKHLPGSYKQSVRSKFDYYRRYHTFTSHDDENDNDNDNDNDNVDVAFAQVDDKNTLAPTRTEGTEVINTTLISPPSSRRNNELAKQILQRRQQHPQTSSRTGTDP